MAWRAAPRLGVLILLGVATCPWPSSAGVVSPEEYETVRTSNAAILNRLGLVPLVQGGAQHRKRLAGSSSGGGVSGYEPARGTSRRDHGLLERDSHVYVVKLPPGPPYYSFSKPLQKLDNASVAKPDPGFRNNGRPDKIYHWNLPIVNKHLGKQQLLHRLMDQRNRPDDLAKIEQLRKRLKLADKIGYLKKLAQQRLVAEQRRDKPTRNNDKWLNYPELHQGAPKGSENATQLKILPGGSEERRSAPEPSSRQEFALKTSSKYWNGEADATSLQGANDVQLQLLPRGKKHRKKAVGASVSYYYAPARSNGHVADKSGSTSISKHFPGNGKPKAFYVMEKSRKPVYYHPLLP